MLPTSSVSDYGKQGGPYERCRTHRAASVWYYKINQTIQNNVLYMNNTYLHLFDMQLEIHVLK